MKYSRHLFKIFSFVSLLLLISCQSEVQKKHIPFSAYEKPLQKVNKFLVRKDNDRIKSFVGRKQWDMQQTQTGLWYQIYEKGNGKTFPKKNNIVELKYSVWLLDGTLCYTSDSTGLKKFRIGQGGVESGLEEAVLMLHVGDKARFIMPPYMAYGILGDQNKIPARSIILYDVELVYIFDN